MGWRSITWIRRLSDAYTVAKSLGVGLVAIVSSGLALYLEQPYLAGGLSMIALILLFVFPLLFLMLPPKGSFYPRYRSWYCLPFRKISWRLGGVQVHDVRDGRTIIGAFACSFRVNRGRIKPQRFNLDFDGRTALVPVTIEVGSKYLSCDQIRYIPKGIWNQCDAQILVDTNLPDDGVTNHPSTTEFMNQFGEFDLVFEYDGKTFRRRFGRNELDMMIQGQSASLHPPASRGPILEDDRN